MYTSLFTLASSVQGIPFSRIGSGIHICRAKTRKLSTSSYTNLFDEHEFVRLLELPTSSKSAVAFSQAFGGGLFHNETIHGIVSPDIRAAFPFPFFNINTGTTGDFRRLEDENEILDNSTPKARENYWQVKTIAAQMRTLSYLQTQMINCAQEIYSSGRGGSLLLVSGGHPFRKSWPINCLFSDSFSLLRIAHELRNSGVIPSGVQFWAVENPLVNSVDRLEKKIRAGAEAFIIQPPLLTDRFTRWWNEANTRGLLDVTEVIVGIPFLTSSRSLAFWLHLTQATGKEGEVLLQEFQRAEACHSVSGVMKGAFFKAWNLRTIEMVKSLPKVSGLHLMPVTARGWRELEVLIGEGNL